jgi:hypothetical protein
LVVASCVSWATAHASPGVAVDLSHLEAEAVPDAAALEQALVMRLLQEGFAIDPLTEEPAIIVAVAGSEDALVLSAKSAYFERSRTIDASGADDAQLQLEVVQKAVELARLAREAAPPPAVAAVAPPPVVEAAIERRVEPQPATRRARWRIGADVGVRSSGPIEASLSARYAIVARLGVMLRASAAKPGDNEAIGVWEQELVAGASYEWSLSPAMTVDVGIAAGIGRHHFELAMPLGMRTGTRFDPAVAVPVRIAVQPWHALELSLWGLAHASREREHVSGDRILWRRDAVEVGAGAGVAVRF